MQDSESTRIGSFSIYIAYLIANFAFDASDIVHIEDHIKEFGSSQRTDDMRPNARLRSTRIGSFSIYIAYLIALTSLLMLLILYT